VRFQERDIRFFEQRAHHYNVGDLGRAQFVSDFGRPESLPLHLGRTKSQEGLRVIKDDPRLRPRGQTCAGELVHGDEHIGIARSGSADSFSGQSRRDSVRCRSASQGVGRQPTDFQTFAQCHLERSCPGAARLVRRNPDLDLRASVMVALIRRWIGRSALGVIPSTSATEAVRGSISLTNGRRGGGRGRR